MEETHRNGISMTRLKISRIGNTETGLGTSKALEDQTTCRLITKTIDGGKPSSMMEKKHSLTCTMKRFLMLLEAGMKKVLMSKSGRRMDQKHNNGN
jgi:hypothetical protein